MIMLPVLQPNRLLDLYLQYSPRYCTCSPHLALCFKTLWLMAVVLWHRVQ